MRVRLIQLSVSVPNWVESNQQHVSMHVRDIFIYNIDVLNAPNRRQVAKLTKFPQNLCLLASFNHFAILFGWCFYISTLHRDAKPRTAVHEARSCSRAEIRNPPRIRGFVSNSFCFLACLTNRCSRRPSQTHYGSSAEGKHYVIVGSQDRD